jgi:hypothetical protein
MTGGCELASCVEGYEKTDNLCVSRKKMGPVTRGLIYSTRTSRWNDPGPKTESGHIAAGSIDECYKKAPAGTAIVGYRTSAYTDPGFEGTCFYYSAPETGLPTGQIPEHEIACMDDTYKMEDGCGVPKVSGKWYGSTAAVGWKDPGSKPDGTIASSIEECMEKAPADAKIVGYRDDAYNDPGYEGTCFYYTQAQPGAPQLNIRNHHLTCKDQSKKVASGCM